MNKIDPNEPAMAMDFSTNGFAMQRGISVRTHLASMAMQGALANPDRAPVSDFESFAQYCTKCADALISELNQNLFSKDNV